MTEQHPWTLVGPWYRSHSLGGSVGNKASRPIVQKYAAADFVDRILAEPQQSLRFVAEDFVNPISWDRHALVNPQSAMLKLANEPLKLFLDTHSRFYLVVCELHCQAPGFPSVQRDKVCEAGFVVRRHKAAVSDVGKLALADIIQQRRVTKNQLLKLQSLQAEALADTNQPAETATLFGSGLGKFTGQVKQRFAASQHKKQQQLQARLVSLGDQFVAASLEHQAQTILQGWIPAAHKNVGSWQAVSATPEGVTERVYPLFPLIADPRDKHHSAQGKALWFGVIPTQSDEVDAQGYPRFDEHALYEIRCFVRRHKPSCPKTRQPGDCPGALVWSRATESYRLADFYDLDGCAHRPINIRLPDLESLKQQAERGPTANVRMSAPEKSMLKFTSNGMDLPTADGVRPGFQICFFPIPLITIVALFLFRLFLPIVVFLFGLWWMLQLRFCIPPTISFDADFAADLKLLGPDFAANIQLKIDASVDGVITIGGVDYDSVNAVEAALKEQFNDEPSLDPNLKSGLTAALGFDELSDLFVAMATDYSESPANEENAGQIPQPLDGLVYFNRVEPS